MKFKIDFKSFFKNNWLLILIGIAIMVVILWISSNQTAFMKKEMAEMKVKVDNLQADINAKQDAINGIDAKLFVLKNNLDQIDANITAGEFNYKSIISQLGNLKALINPPIVVFDTLEACKSSFEDLQRKFSLSIKALDQRETDFNLCKDKNTALSDTVVELQEKCSLQEGISKDYKMQYETAKNTLETITKTWKWKTIAGNAADAGMIAGAGALLSKGNWKAAAGIVVARYIGKLLFKI